MGKTSVELLIFDLDGTLIESKWDIAASVNFTSPLSRSASARSVTARKRPARATASSRRRPSAWIESRPVHESLVA